MDQFYEITLKESDLIPDFFYEQNGVKCLFTLKSGLQKNGNYLLRKYVYDKLSEQLKELDLSGKKLKIIKDLDFAEQDDIISLLK